MRNKRIALSLILLSTLIIGNLPAAVAAQQAKAELYGTVIDETRAFMPAVPVVLEDRAGKKVTATTDANGRYRFVNLTPGVYTLTVAVEGFAAFAEEVDLTGKTSLTFDVTLKVFIADQIEVTDKDARISTDPDNNLSAITLSDEKIDALPDDPDEMLEVLRQMAGATGGNDAAGIYVDGFRENGRLPPKESILRIRLNSNPFSAEFNEPGNSRIEIITRPGADTYRGSFRLNFNDESLNARNAFAPVRAPLQVRNYNFNLTGPFIKNRWGFFINFDRREEDENEVILATVLNPLTLLPESFADTVVTPTRGINFSFRTDFLINPKHTLGFQYRVSNREQINQGINGFDLPERAFNSTRRDHDFRFSLTTILSEAAVNEFRAQFSQRRSQSQAITDAPAVIVLDAFSSGGNQGSLFSDSTNRELEFSNNITYTRGNHTIKFGVRAEGEREELLNRSNFGGTFTFGTDVERDADGNPILDGNGNPVSIAALELYRRVLAGVAGYRPSQFSVVRGDPALRIQQWEMGWFAQDDWRINQRLTLSYGVRHEFQTNLEDKWNLAPRFGMVWQPDKKGVSTLRFGTGIFYDFVSDSITLDTIRFDGERQRQFFIERPNFFAEIPEVLDGAITRQPTIRIKDARLKMPYSYITTVSYERQLPGKVMGTIGYTYNKGVNLLRSRNINTPELSAEGEIISLPFPGEGPILQYETSARSIRHELRVGFNTSIGGVSLFGNYTLSRTQSDADGAGQTPANPFDLSTEWGRSSRDARHQFFFGGSIRLPWDVRMSPFVNITSGRPFNITTGRDNNRDTIFNDRPAFAEIGDPEAVVTPFGVFNPNPQAGDVLIPRNFGQGPGAFTVNLNFSKNFSFGPSRGGNAARAGNRNENQPPDAQMGGGGRRGGGGFGGGGRRGGGGGRGGGGFGGGDAGSGRQRYNLSLGVNVRNLFNNVNLASYNGVLTSPFFGTANRTLAARRVEAVLNFRF